MSDIKKELIKLAYENPELRGDLLRIILAGEEPEKVGEWYIKFHGQPFLVFKDPSSGVEKASPVASVEKVSGSPETPHKDDEYLIYSRSGKNRKVKMSDAVVDKMEHFLDNGETAVSSLISDFRAVYGKKQTRLPQTRVANAGKWNDLISQVEAMEHAAHNINLKHDVLPNLSKRLSDIWPPELNGQGLPEAQGYVNAAMRRASEAYWGVLPEFKSDNSKDYAAWQKAKAALKGEVVQSEPVTTQSVETPYKFTPGGHKMTFDD